MVRVFLKSNKDNKNTEPGTRILDVEIYSMLYLQILVSRIEVQYSRFWCGFECNLEKKHTQVKWVLDRWSKLHESEGWTRAIWSL